MDLVKIKKAENIEHWREESLTWWRLYLGNLKMIRQLREENRHLRKLNVTMKEVVDDWVADYLDN